MTRPIAFLRGRWVGAPRHVAMGLALAIVLSSSVGHLAAATARGWDENAFGDGSEALLVTLQNEARASEGLRPLTTDAALRAVARWRSRDMVERGFFSHRIPGPGLGAGTTPGAGVAAAHEVFWYLQYRYGYCFKVAGENIGRATWPGATEADVTSYVLGLFMGSPRHRANILGDGWDVVAVGAYRTTGDRYVWTVLFADRCDASSSIRPGTTWGPDPSLGD